MRIEADMLVMRAEGLLNGGMAMAPVAFLLFVAIQARGTSSSHVILTPPPEGQHAINAFVEPVRLVSALRMPQTAKIGDADGKARGVARYWIDAWRAGQLRRLPRISYADSVRDGYRGAIYQAQQRLMLEVRTLADEAEANGDLARAIEDHVILVELAEILKFEDLVSVCSHALAQRLALRDIERLGGPTPSQMARLRSAFNRSDPLMALANLLEREYRLFVVCEDVPAEARTSETFRIREFSAALRSAYYAVPPRKLNQPGADLRGNGLGLMLVARKAAVHIVDAQRILERLADQKLPIGRARSSPASDLVALRRDRELSQ